VPQAAACFEEALTLRPGWSPAVEPLAWILATTEDAEIRNPRRALELAEEAVRRGESPSAKALDTLAAAYAATGNFSDAVRTAERALVAVRRSGPADLARGIEARLGDYRAGKAVVIRAGSSQ
jgi:hypothetical protein